jgi:MFS family permease
VTVSGRSKKEWQQPTQKFHGLRSIGDLLGVRLVRALADGLIAASIATYLAARGLNAQTIGLFITATMIGSAVLVTLGGLFPHRLTPARVVVGTSALMVAVGVGFAQQWPLWALGALAVIGPLNPSGGDISAFLPAEQSLVADVVGREQRSAAFARFSLAAALGAALGGLAAGIPQRLMKRPGWSTLRALSIVFWIYAAVGVFVGFAYASRTRRMMHRAERVGAATPVVKQFPLSVSRKTVRDLAALFSLDAAGGGFVVTSLLALWLAKRFNFDLTQVGGTLALMSLLSAVSALLAPLLVRKYGPVHTMVFTHIPAQLFLIAAAFVPSAQLAVVCLALRSLTSSLDVPARTAFVMNVVTEPERAAAASFTNIPRSLAASSTPALAGWMLARSTIGWPLIAGGICKLIYDCLLFIRFRHLDAEVMLSAAGQPIPQTS